MENEPIEIRPGDIIPRPVNAESLTGAAREKSPNFLQQIKDGLNQAKEIKKTLEDMGFKVGGGQQAQGAVLPPNAQIRGGEPPPNTALSPAEQVLNFVRLLQLRYGDMSVKELIAKLVEDYGDKKLSEFTKRK